MILKDNQEVLDYLATKCDTLQYSERLQQILDCWTSDINFGKVLENNFPDHANNDKYVVISLSNDYDTNRFFADIGPFAAKLGCYFPIPQISYAYLKTKGFPNEISFILSEYSHGYCFQEMMQQIEQTKKLMSFL